MRLPTVHAPSRLLDSPQNHNVLIDSLPTLHFIALGMQHAMRPGCCNKRQQRVLYRSVLFLGSPGAALHDMPWLCQRALALCVPGVDIPMLPQGRVLPRASC